MSCPARLERNLVCVRKAPHNADAEGGHVFETPRAKPTSTPAPPIVEPPVCPECAQGKHQNCTIFVYDANDELRSCKCMLSDHADGEVSA